MVDGKRYSTWADEIVDRKNDEWFERFRSDCWTPGPDFAGRDGKALACFVAGCPRAGAARGLRVVAAMMGDRIGSLEVGFFVPGAGSVNKGGGLRIAADVTILPGQAVAIWYDLASADMKQAEAWGRGVEAVGGIAFVVGEYRWNAAGVANFRRLIGDLDVVGNIDFVPERKPGRGGE